MTDPSRPTTREERRALIKQYINGQEEMVKADMAALTAPSPSSPEYGAWLADQFQHIPLPQGPQSVRGVDGSKDGA